MATVTKIFDGLSLHFQNGIGGIVQRYQIEGLTASNDPADLLNNGIAASNIFYTMPHPTISGIFAATFDAKPLVEEGGSVSRTSCLLEVGYSTPTFLPLGGVKVEISGSNSQELLNRWPGGPLQGQPILVGFNPDRTFQAPVNNAAQIDPAAVIAYQNAISNGSGGSSYIPPRWAFDSVEIPIESPNLILTLTRTEFKFPKANLLYRRTLNSNAWLGFDPLTVLCRQISAQNIIGAGTIAPSYYVVQYTFEIVDDPVRWQRTEIFRDEHTGKNIVVDINSDTFNGYTTVIPYRAADFNGMKFPNDLLANDVLR